LKVADGLDKNVGEHLISGDIIIFDHASLIVCISHKVKPDIKVRCKGFFGGGDKNACMAVIANGSGTHLGKAHFSKHLAQKYVFLLYEAERLIFRINSGDCGQRLEA
jgi:hypothetical protein